MKRNNFLAKLAILDIRRHASGLKRQWMQDDSLRGKILQDLAIFVLYTNASTPRMKIDRIDEAEVAKADGDKERNQNLYEKMRETLCAGKMTMFLQYFRGGNSSPSEVLQPDIMRFIEKASTDADASFAPGDPKMPPFARVAASTYDRENSRPFRLYWTRSTSAF